MQSEQINELAAALSKAQGEFDHAKKAVENGFFKSKYADLASCIDAAKLHLTKNGLAVIQTTSIIESGSVVLRTLLTHSSGQWVDSVYPIEPVKRDPQGLGSAFTYARRYCFCAITGIAADDDDGNAASRPVKQEPKKEPELNDSALVDFQSQLESSVNLASLSANWQTIPKPYRAKLESVKNTMKAKLQEAA